MIALAGAIGGREASDILLEAEDVAEGVGEPGDFCAAGGGPDGEGVGVVHSGIAVELDSGGGELTCGGFDVLNPPAEDGELLGLEVAGEGGAEGSAIEIEDEGEGGLVVDEGEAELIAVEGQGFVFVGDGDEGYVRDAG
jgi:hypothetical protein